MGHTRIGVLSDTHMPGGLRTMWDEVRVAFETERQALIRTAVDMVQRGRKAQPQVVQQALHRAVTSTPEAKLLSNVAGELKSSRRGGNNRRALIALGACALVAVGVSVYTRSLLHI